MKSAFSSPRSRRHRNPTPEKTAQQEPFFANGDQHAAKAPFFQPKLAINQPGDPYEREADAVADRVVSQPATDPAGVQRQAISQVQRLATPDEKDMPSTNDARMAEDKRIQEKPEVQRAEAPEEEPVQKAGKEEEEPVQKAEKEEEKPVQAKEEKEEPVQAKEEEEPVQKAEKEEEEPVQKAEKEEEKPVQAKEEKEEPVQAKEEEEPVQKAEAPGAKEEEQTGAVQAKSAQGGASQAPANFGSRLSARRGAGAPLPRKVRTQMEQGIGADFSGVRVHTDTEAAQMSDDIHAQAFTNGRDVYFNSGKYDPDSTSGQRLLAHELTHVVQQDKNATAPSCQRRLPNITQPHIPNLPGLPEAQRQSLIAAVQAYLDSPSDPTGQSAVNAILQVLSGAGSVNYRHALITTNSPDFRMRPSLAAMEAGYSGNDAGFTFGQNGLIKVEIYREAFQIGSSAEEKLGYLAGVIVHEYIHALQNIAILQRAGTTATNAEMEFQAWLWEAENMGSLGIRSQSEASAQISGNLERYFQQMPAATQRSLRARYTNALAALNAERPRPTTRRR